MTVSDVVAKRISKLLKERGFTVQIGKSFGFTARQYAVHYER